MSNFLRTLKLVAGVLVVPAVLITAVCLRAGGPAAIGMAAGLAIGALVLAVVEYRYG